MPHVFLFGRELSFSSDEMGIVGVVGIAYRLLWVGISVTFGLNALNANEQCSVTLTNNGTITEAPLFNATLFLGLLAGQSALQVLLFVALLYATTRGTIIQIFKRWAVPYIVAIMFVFELLLVGTSAFGVYALTMLPDEDGVEVCEVLLTKVGSAEDQDQLRHDLVEDLDMVTFYTLIGVIFSIVNNLGFMLLMVLSQNRSRAKRSADAYERNVSVWDSRLRRAFRFATVFTCGVFGSITGSRREAGYRAMAEIFTDYFKDSGLSSLDAFAALLLIRAEQREAKRIAVVEREVRSEMFSAPAKLIGRAGRSDNESPHHDVGDELGDFLNDATTYAPYMLAVYNWKLFMVMHRGSPLRNIHKVMLDRKKVGKGKEASHIVGKSIDVMHASFVCVASHQVPYVVAVDHHKKKVLLIIRGTNSLGDLFTDVVLKPKQLVEAGELWGFEGDGHYAHPGFLAVALEIRRQLELTGVLHKLLGELKQLGKRHLEPVEGITTECVVEVDSRAIPDVNLYQLVLIGHSMGAGVSALLGLLLRPVFPSLFCMAYSMPGTVLSLKMAEQCSEWMRTVWVGEDFVARGSYRALEVLRERMYDVLVRCKVNKTTVLRSLFTKMPVNRLLHAPDATPDTPESRQLDNALRIVRKLENEFNKFPLYTPGKMMHLVNQSKRKFVPTWVHDRTVMKEVEISSRMLVDHFPDFVATTVANVAEEYCYFSPTSDKLLSKMTSPRTAMKSIWAQSVNPQFGLFDEDEELKTIANSV